MSKPFCLGESRILEPNDVVGEPVEGIGSLGVVRNVQKLLDDKLQAGNSDFCTTHVRNGVKHESIEPILKPYCIVGPGDKVLHTTVGENFSGHYLLIEAKQNLITVFFALRPEKG